MKILLSLLLPFVLFASAHAQDCPDVAPYAKAREVVRDLDRITAPNGVQEAYATKIGGIDQWLDVRGQDRGNPVILFVHGGPASPVTPTLWQFERPLEEYFTIVNWDQRGAGKTFNSVDPQSIADTIHIQRYVDDAIEVAEYVRKRYRQDKLILMAHSWGTIVAMKAALARPDLFHAYVGIGQVVNTRENERISFDYGLEQAKARGNTTAVKELESIAPYPGDQPITRERIVIARKWAQYYGGLSAFRDDSKYYFDGAMLSPDYDARDVCAIDRGNVFTLGRILPEFLAVDFTGVRRFPIPIVMFMGRHDYTTPSAPTAAWLDRLEAPSKQGVWFERSAHMIPWEEPGKTLVSLLAYVRPLADRKRGAGARTD
ncbi:MAG: alpha/beta fold hydrolase [Dokdonella sp.]|uniref:alpha/beta fold hydrolase n=1 Tax=Dokdonella sp. TaxID=2291710 RepID=UPI003F81B3EA